MDLPLICGRMAFFVAFQQGLGVGHVGEGVGDDAVDAGLGHVTIIGRISGIERKCDEKYLRKNSVKRRWKREKKNRFSIKLFLSLFFRKSSSSASFTIYQKLPKKLEKYEPIKTFSLLKNSSKCR